MPIFILFASAGLLLDGAFSLWVSLNSYSLCHTLFRANPVDTARKLNVHKTFIRRPGRLLNVLCTFKLRPCVYGEANFYLSIGECHWYDSYHVIFARSKSSSTSKSFFLFHFMQGCTVKTYSEPCQTSKIEHFAYKRLIIFTKCSILDVWQSFE